MKKFFKLLVVALALGVIMVTFKIYINESKKVSALQNHMSFLAGKGDVIYISLEEEDRLKKEERKRIKAEKKFAKEEATRIANEEKAAKKAEEKRLKEEEIQRLKEEIEKEKNKFKSLVLDIPVINQLPEYKNGCEATSVTMMLNYAGVDVDKHSVIKRIKMDATPIKYDSNGRISEWGNPRLGFVGDITGKMPGYSIDPVALVPVINEYLPGKSLDLTGCEFNTLESTLLSGRPIVVWITSNFREPAISHTWTSHGETINSYFSQHSVLLTGIDGETIYYNDPLTGVKGATIDKITFELVWTKMGSKAISYYK